MNSCLKNQRNSMKHCSVLCWTLFFTLFSTIAIPEKSYCEKKATLSDIEVTVLKHVSIQRLIERDNTGMAKPSRHSRTDTTISILSPKLFLTEVASKSGTFTYLFDIEKRTMTIFNWKGTYATLPMDSIGFYRDSLDKLNLPEKLYHLSQMKQFYQSIHVDKFLLTGWERDVLTGKLKWESDKMEDLGFAGDKKIVTDSSFEIAPAEENTDSTPKKKRGRPSKKGRSGPEKVKVYIPLDLEKFFTSNLTEEERARAFQPPPREDTASASVERRKRVAKRAQLLAGAMRDGGMNIQVFPRHLLDSVESSLDSVFASDTMLGMEADKYIWKWKSSLYSLSGTSRIVPHRSSPFDLSSQSLFDDNLFAFASLENSNRMPILLPMGQGFWNDRGLCVSQSTTLTVDNFTFDITRQLIEISPQRVSPDAFAVSDKYLRMSWIDFEIDQALSGFYDK